MPCHLRHAVSAAITLLLSVGITPVGGHPGCFDDGGLVEDADLVFCPVEDEGVCCTPLEEEEGMMQWYNSGLLDPLKPMDEYTEDDQECLRMWKEVRAHV